MLSPDKPRDCFHIGDWLDWEIGSQLWRRSLELSDIQHPPPHPRLALSQLVGDTLKYTRVNNCHLFRCSQMDGFKCNPAWELAGQGCFSRVGSPLWVCAPSVLFSPLLLSGSYPNWFQASNPYLRVCISWWDLMASSGECFSPHPKFT